jgi:hypothetical protein
LPALPTPPSRSDLTAFSAYVWPFLRAPRPLWFALTLDAAVFAAAVIALRIVGGGGPVAEIVPPANAASRPLIAVADDLYFAPPPALEAPFAPVAGIPEARHFTGSDAIVASNPQPATEAPATAPQRTPKLLAYASDTLANTGDRAARAREAIDDLLPGGRAPSVVPAAIANVTASAGANVESASSVVASTASVTTVTKSTVGGAADGVGGTVRGVGGKLGLTN